MRGNNTTPLHYFDWIECPNCHESQYWQEDSWVSISTAYYRLRLYCWCGHDEWPGGYLRPGLASSLVKGDSHEE